MILEIKKLVIRFRKMLRFYKMSSFCISTKLYLPCFLKLAHVDPYLTLQKLISDGVDGEYLAKSRTQTRRAIETLCSAAVVKLASARHPKPSLPSPQELSQRKSFLPLPPTRSPPRSWVSSPSPPRRSSSWLPFAPVPPSFPSVSDVKKDA